MSTAAITFWGCLRQKTSDRGHRTSKEMERAAGIEPASLAWKAKVLPLHNARALTCLVCHRPAAVKFVSKAGSRAIGNFLILPHGAGGPAPTATPGRKVIAFTRA
jgi:hypothetical protein